MRLYDRLTGYDRIGVGFDHEPLHQPKRKGEEEEHEEHGGCQVAEDSDVDAGDAASALLAALVKGDEIILLP